MQLSASHYLGDPVVEVRGEVDHSSSQALWQICDRALAEGDTAALDLGGCPCMDSGGISILLALLKRVRLQGTLGVITPDPDVPRIFHIVRLSLDPSFHLLASRDEVTTLAG
jgi:anti-anti-sigma factor